MRSAISRIACLLLRLAAWFCLAVLFTWLAAYLATGDRFGYLALANLLAMYLFFPLPLALLAALLCRSRWLGIGFAAGLAAFLWLWGVQFLPGRGGSPEGNPTLSVMTYNVLAWHEYTGPVLDTIRTEDPDVVCLQELNHNLARALETEMANEYPYQALEPVDNPSGIGVISKIPFRPVQERMPHSWIGGPVIVSLEWNGRALSIVNFHMRPTTGVGPRSAIRRDFQARNEQARLLVDYALRNPPSILCGDANSGPLSQAYRIFTADLHDAWREAGTGLGHTFPGSTIRGSDRPRIGPWYVPPWLARIDYIFFTDDWAIVEARMAKIDGVSDHRGVVGVFYLLP